MSACVRSAMPSIRLLDDVGHCRPHAVDLVRQMRRPEVVHHQAPDPVMLGRIECDEGGDCPGSAVRGLRSPGSGQVAPVRADPWVVQQRDDLPVGADDVASVLLARPRAPAQLGVQRVRIGAVGVIENLLKDAGRCHDVPSRCSDRLATGRCHCWPYTSSARRSPGSWPVTTTVA